MSDPEFETMDELYFVTDCEALEYALPQYKDHLKNILKSLLDKGFIKCMDIHDGEKIIDMYEFDLNYRKYKYLATKAGLQAHNSR